MNRVKAENVAMRFNALAKHPSISYAVGQADRDSFRVIQLYDGEMVGVALGARGRKKTKRVAALTYKGGEANVY